MLNFFFAWRLERATIRRLARLSDRELQDIGIRRDTVKSVVRNTRGGSATAASTMADDQTLMAPSWGNHLRRTIA